MPDEGLVFGYDFTLEQGGKQNVWATNRLRMGAERFSVADRRRAVATVFPTDADDQRPAAADVERTGLDSVGPGGLEGRQASLRDAALRLQGNRFARQRTDGSHPAHAGCRLHHAERVSAQRQMEAG